MIFGPKIGLRSDLLSQDFLREACPQAPQILHAVYGLWPHHLEVACYGITHTSTWDLVSMYKSSFTFIWSMQMGEYIIEAPRMPWSWCSSYSMVAKNIVSETTWVQGPKKGVRYFIPMLSIEAKIYSRTDIFSERSLQRSNHSSNCASSSQQQDTLALG